jgi:hypothetical protein
VAALCFGARSAFYAKQPTLHKGQHPSANDFSAAAFARAVLDYERHSVE